MASLSILRKQHPNPIALRPTFMEVNLNAISHNFSILDALAANSIVMPIVKANAYGHGLADCSRHLANCGAKRLGVAFVEEGIELRQAGIDIPIHVLGGIFDNQIRLFIDYDLELTASSVDKLRQIEEVAAATGARAKVHLKIDTGMERIGVHYYNAAEMLEVAASLKRTEVVGLFSHFATGNDPNLSFSKTQLSRFLEAVSYFHDLSPLRPLRHIASSGSALQFSESHLDMIRPGIATYGVYPASHLIAAADLRPAMSIRSKVVFFKVVRQGASVGYNCTWVAEKDTRVVTIPMGYGDGYFKRLSNRGQVLIRGKRYPIIGSVCMDQIMVDIGDDEAYNGDEVVLLGAQGSEKITVGEIASLIDTNPHEVLVSTNLRVPRRYTGD